MKMRFRYRPFLAVPIVLLVFAGAYLANGYNQTGEWFSRSIDLKGGTLITLKGDFTVSAVEDALLGFDARVRKIGGFGGEGVLIETPPEISSENIISALEGKGFNTKDASIQTIGPSLGESFWRQAQLGIVFAFVLMGIVVFFLFRKVVPSFAVIFAAVSDILVALAFMQVFSIQLSLAGLAALLMLIGYSVDTNILLTSRMFKGEGEVQERLKGALKTGLTMSITTMSVLIVLILTGVSSVITQIATVLFIGLVVDLVNTWLMNAGVLRWYMERKSVGGAS